MINYLVNAYFIYLILTYDAVRPMSDTASASTPNAHLKILYAQVHKPFLAKCDE